MEKPFVTLVSGSFIASLSTGISSLSGLAKYPASMQSWAIRHSSDTKASMVQAARPRWPARVKLACIFRNYRRRGLRSLFMLQAS
jgi:hypothetical protein